MLRITEQKSTAQVQSYYQQAQADDLLPIGLASGARLARPVLVDTPIRTTDVEIEPSTVYMLHRLQEQWFRGAVSDPDLLAAASTRFAPSGPP